mmetsp:Transcript_54786/g.97507  ORF Transcript_54786/g.97507 Transcript_54786/m.97507 type:complete len:83 (-) Transcript_54786:2340-2588(-)
MQCIVSGVGIPPVPHVLSSPTCDGPLTRPRGLGLTLLKMTVTHEVFSKYPATARIAHWVLKAKQGAQAVQGPKVVETGDDEG